MQLLQHVQPKRFTAMLDTKVQQENTAARLVKIGYKYVVGWRDLQGYGLMAVQFAEWQGGDSAPYINLR